MRQTKHLFPRLLVLVYLFLGVSLAGADPDEPPKPNQPPEGFRALFNGRDLLGWQGVLAPPNDNPIRRRALGGEDYAKKLAEANKDMRQHWTVRDGVLEFDGKGFSLSTDRTYGDFELLVDWKLITEKGDSGIYLRGGPQVQIWDPGYRQIGSGGLYNNQKHPSQPLVIADRPIGQWNTFRIRMVQDRVSVHLNDKLVVDDVVMENYWDRQQPMFARGPIELQCHGDPIHFRNIFIRELPRPGEFKPLFNGRDLTGWQGDTQGYVVQDGVLVCKPGGNLYSRDEFDDFVFRFEFKLTDGANNGLGIRAPLEGDAAYNAMEIQILDDSSPKYGTLQPYQYHGSIYGVVPARRGHLLPVGQWNVEEVIAVGPHVTVNLNGHTIVDADIQKESTPETMDHREHPGLLRPGGHVCFCGHGDVLEFRRIRICPLERP